jgi:hypothetical protein
VKKPTKAMQKNYQLFKKLSNMGEPYKIPEGVFLTIDPSQKPPVVVVLKIPLTNPTFSKQATIHVNNIVNAIRQGPGRYS